MPKRKLTPTDRARKFLKKENSSKLKKKMIQIAPKTWIEVDENDPRYHQT